MTDILDGAYFPKDELTLPYIWVSLNVNAELEQEILGNSRLSKETSRISDEINNLLKALQNVPVRRWCALCEAAGWTVYGAIGVSWCVDAKPEHFWHAWQLSKYTVKPGNQSERPCSFINPPILPATDRLSDIIAGNDLDSSAICATIAAKPELLMDIETPQIAALPAAVRAFIEYRSGQICWDS